MRVTAHKGEGRKAEPRELQWWVLPGPGWEDRRVGNWRTEASVTKTQNPVHLENFWPGNGNLAQESLRRIFSVHSNPMRGAHVTQVSLANQGIQTLPLTGGACVT